MVEKLFGHWKLEKNENFDEYMSANIGSTITSYEEISKDGDTWTINITSTFKSTKLVFKIGEPFTEHTLDGRTVTCTFTIEGDILVATQEPIKTGDLPSRFERIVLDDGRMILTCISTPSNTVAKRYFLRYNP